MNVNRCGRAIRVLTAVLVAVLPVIALPGCKSGSSTPQSQAGSDGGPAKGDAVGSVKKIDYGSLLTLDDVKRITAIEGAATMDPGTRRGDSPYYVLFTGPTTPQFLSFRVGKPSFYDEQLRLLGDEATKLTVGGNEAFSWDSARIDDSGIAVRMPDKSTYVVVSKWLHKTPPGKSQLTPDQLKQVAELVVERSK